MIMSHILIDSENEIIPIDQKLIQKSDVLTDFFTKYPNKGFKLNQSNHHIKQMIELMDNKYVGKKDKELIELCEQLHIDTKNTKSFDLDPEEIEGKQITQSMCPHGYIQYIYNCIFYKANEKFWTQWIESTVDGIYQYKLSAIQNRMKVYPKNENVPQMQLISHEEFTKNFIGDQNSHICHDHTGTQYNYRKIILKPMYKIVVDICDIGKIVSTLHQDIVIDKNIFDGIVSLLVERMDSNQCKNIIHPRTDGSHVIKIQQNYSDYIVKIKRIIVDPMNPNEVRQGQVEQWDPMQLKN